MEPRRREPLTAGIAGGPPTEPAVPERAATWQAGHLRLIVELELPPTRTATHIGGDTFRELARDGGSFDAHPQRAEGAAATLDQLTWWADALRTAHAATARVPAAA